MADTKNVLTPEELEALSSGIEDGSIESDTGINSDIEAVKHDLASEDSSLGMNLSAVNLINERFVRFLKNGISDVLRTSAKVTAEGVAVMTYEEYISGLQAPIALNTVTLHPLTGRSLIVIDPSIIFTALDNFFGGPGKTMGDLVPTRAFTPTEISINKIMLDILSGSLHQAWAPVQHLKCDFTDLSNNPAAVKIVEKHESVVVSRFVTEFVSKSNGIIDIVYPYSALKSIRELLESRVQASSETTGSKLSWTADLMGATMDAEVEVKVTLGSVTCNYMDFEELKEGDVLFFKKPDHAIASAEGMPLFKGDLGTVDSHMAIQFVERIEP